MRSSWVLRREPRGAQSATSGQGSAQDATRGSDARRLGLSGVEPLPRGQRAGVLGRGGYRQSRPSGVGPGQ